MKTGRNEPCPCGSGKKFKRCCGSGSPPKDRVIGGYYDPERKAAFVATNDILRKTISRDAPLIGNSFDRLCGVELASIGEVFSAAAFIVLAGNPEELCVAVLRNGGAIILRCRKAATILEKRECYVR